MATHEPAPVQEAQLDAHGLPFKGEMTIAQEQELKHRSTKVCRLCVCVCVPASYPCGSPCLTHQWAACVCCMYQAVWEVVKREVDLRAQESRLETFDRAFERIKENTGIETIDEMVAEFCDAEDHNFSLINVINGLNKEVEQLEVQNADMEQKLREAKGKGQETLLHRNQIFSALETQIRASEKKARWYNHKYDEAMKAIDAIKTGTLSIFSKVGCNDKSMQENVTATGITDTNLMQVLGTIEQRIAEIVQMNELALGRLGKKPERRSLSKLERADTSFLPSTLESDSDDGGVALARVWSISCFPSSDCVVLCVLCAFAEAPLSLAQLKARTAHEMTQKIAVRVRLRCHGFVSPQPDHAC